MSERSGYIYYQPFASGNGYVGQTIQPYGVREYQHTRANHNAFGSYAIESNVPMSQLNAREAYNIGRYDTYSPYGNNLTRGNSRLDYDSGSARSFRSLDTKFADLDARFAQVSRKFDAFDRTR